MGEAGRGSFLSFKMGEVGRGLRFTLVFLPANELARLLPEATEELNQPTNRTAVYLPIYLPLINSGYDPASSILISAGEFQMGCDPTHNDGYSCNSDELPLQTI